ncbi:MAG TPA: hypothetical protein VLR89_06555 [Anaerolineaceae bacterium]|nr:hypothetical protein [Anaerolineaceae bacterium]
MKTFRIFLLIALPLLMLVACAPSPAATISAPVVQATAVPSAVVVEPSVGAPEVTETSAPVVAATEPTATAPVTLSDAEMEALITEKAKPKHTLEFILSQNKTAEEWSVTLDRMVKNGAKINAEEKELIINWLVGRKK